MGETVHILCAMHDTAVAKQLYREMDDGEHCLFDIVGDGDAAIRHCRKHMPDILVLDAVLPLIDGLGVLDYLHEMDGGLAPRVIGGSVTAMSCEGFFARGAQAVVSVPWNAAELKRALLTQMTNLQAPADWTALEPMCQEAEKLLVQMGMNSALKGFIYLASAAALAHDNRARLHAIGKRIYAPIALHCHTTPANVERLIRHAIESTMSAAQARGVYVLFGNTIDPSKGKPTNAHVIALLAQRMRLERSKALQKRAYGD